jgi:hypothetical protein
VIPVVVAGVLGGAIGAGIYYALAAPVLALTAGRSGGTSAALARELHALAVRCIRESPSVPCAAPSIPPPHAPQKAAAPGRL